MTHEQIEQHRRRFDEIYPEGNKYYRQTLFKGYLMFAENLEVELPEVESDGFAPSVNYHELVDKLESQGIKVKP